MAYWSNGVMAKGLTSFFQYSMTPVLDRVFQEPLIFYTVMQKAQVIHLLPRRARRGIEHMRLISFVIFVFFVVQKHWIELTETS